MTNKKKKTEKTGIQENFNAWLETTSIDWLCHPIANTTELAKRYLKEGLNEDLEDYNEAELQELQDALQPFKDDFVKSK